MQVHVCGLNRGQNEFEGLSTLDIPLQPIELAFCCAANLEENEKIKAELAPTKINEPKTPFHASYSEDEDVDTALDPEDGRQKLHFYSMSSLRTAHADASSSNKVRRAANVRPWFSLQKRKQTWPL